MFIIKNKEDIKKAAVTLALLQALTLSGCKSQNVDPIDHNSLFQMISSSDTLKDSNGRTYPKEVNLFEEEYTDVPSDENIYDLNYIINPDSYNKGVRLYNKKGKDIGAVYDYQRVKVLKTNGIYSLILLNNKEYYVYYYSLLKVPNINNGEYTVITDNKEMVCDDWINVYDINGRYKGYDWGNSEVTAVATNGEYTLITFNNGFEGYVESSKLSPKYVHKNAHAYIRKGTPIYGDKELTRFLYYETDDHITYVHMDDGNYAYIGNEYYKEVYYVKSSDLEYTEDFVDFRAEAYIEKSIPLYQSKELNNQIDTLDPYSHISIYCMSNSEDWVNIYDNNHHITGYIRKGDYILTDGNFIDVDLSDQSIDVYKDGYVDRWGYTRTGKDSSPTHTGVFDIDWKAKDWEFTNYPGCYANYWIPYNEYGEGFHDLRGDDSQNYGNEAYHQYGSHGCVRVTSGMSEYIYNNCDVGTLVLVHK